jgi:S1-C subfamily serine protease
MKRFKPKAGDRPTRALVGRIVPESPDAEAGIEPGDIIAV